MENENLNENPLPEEEAPVEEAPAPEEAPEEKPLEEAPEENLEPETEEEKPEEPNEPSPLEEALKLVLAASEEELAALPEETQKAYAEWVAKRVEADLVNRLEWVKKAIFSLRDTMIKGQEENEEFRVLSKNTLQRNVQLLEDQVKFNQYNKILKELATIYSSYCFVLNDTSIDPKVYSNLEGIFDELEMLLENYGAEKVTAKVGDDFDPIVSKIAKRIITDDPSLDKKIAAFKAPGFRKGKVILSYLKADMYVYQEPSAQQ